MAQQAAQTTAQKTADGLRVVVGVGLRALVPSLVERLASRRDPFERPFVCVPHREVQTWLRRQIADALGVCMNIEHGTLDDVLFEAARLATGEAPELWEPLSLAGAIRRELARGAKARDWLDGEASPETLERRRFVVARQLAELFLAYDRTHPDLLDAWTRGEDPTSHPDASWQADLWRRVQARASGPSTVSQLTRLVQERRPKLARPVHVIGFGHFSEREQRALEALAAITDVTVYLDTLASDDEWASAAPESPLARWGRPLRQSHDRLRSHATVVASVSAARGAPRTALEKLRRSLADPGSVRGAVPDDGSVVIAGAPGERREAEVVANAVVESVVDDAHPAAHHLSDVTVLLPRFSEQIAWLEDRFDALGHLPRSVPHGGRSARLFTLVEAMLALPATSFERAFVIDVLLHPCFRGAELLAGASGLCAAAGIYLGADGADGELAYLQGAPCFTWAQGLDRLLLSSVTHDVPELAVPAVAEAPLPLLELPGADEGAPSLFAFASSLLADLRHLAAWRASAASWSRALDLLFRTYVEARDEGDERALHSLLRTVERLALLGADDDETPLTFAEVVAALESELATRGGGYGRPLTDGVTVARMAADRLVPRDAVVVMGLGEGQFPSRTRLPPWDVRSSSAAPWATGADLERLALLQAIFSAERRLVLTWVSMDPARDADLAPSALLVELCTAWPALADAIRKHPLKPYSDEYFGEGAKQRSFDDHAARTAAAMQLAVGLEEQRQRGTSHSGELFDLPTWRRALPPELVRKAGLALPPARKREAREGARRMSLWTFRGFLLEPAAGVAADGLRMRSWSLDADEEAVVDHEPLGLQPSPIWGLVRSDVAWSFVVEHAGRGAPDDAAIDALVDRELARLEQRGRIPVGRMRPGDLHAHVATLLTNISRALDGAGAWGLELCVPVVGSSSVRLPVCSHRPAVRLACEGRPIELTHQRSALFRGDGEAVLLGFSGSTSARSEADADFRLRLELLILLLAGFVEEGAVVDTVFVSGSDKGSPATGRFRLPTRAEAEAYFVGLATEMEGGMPRYRLPLWPFVECVRALLDGDEEQRRLLHEAVCWSIADNWPRRDDDDRWRRTAALRDHDGLRLPTAEELREIAASRFQLLLDMEVEG